MKRDLILLVDDVRDVGGVDIIARNVESAKKTLRTLHRDIGLLLMDHDLDSLDEDGVDVIAYACANHFLPPVVVFVTANPVGKKNMVHHLEYRGYVRKVPVKGELCAGRELIRFCSEYWQREEPSTRPEDLVHAYSGPKVGKLGLRDSFQVSDIVEVLCDSAVVSTPTEGYSVTPRSRLITCPDCLSAIH